MLSSDLPLGLALLAVGAISVAVASRQDRAFDLVPSMEGCLTAGVVGFALALLAGVAYRRALVLLSPIVAIQAMGALLHNASVPAVIGIEAVVVGLVGTGLALRARTPAPVE